MKRSLTFLFTSTLLLIFPIKIMANYVIISTSSGVKYSFEKSVIELSQTVRNITENMIINMVINLPNIAAKELEIIGVILDSITAHGNLDLRNLKYASPRIEYLIRHKIKDINIYDLYILAATVKYLDIPVIYGTILNETVEKIVALDEPFSGSDMEFDGILAPAVAEKNGVASWVFSKELENTLGSLSPLALPQDGTNVVLDSSEELVRVFNVLNLRKLSLKEIQILGFKKANKILNKDAEKIFKKIKRKYPEVIKRLELKKEECAIL